MKNKEILFYLHGGNLNRGCEAIITSTSKLIKNRCNNTNITIATQYYDSDIEREIPNIDKYIKSEDIQESTIINRVYRYALRRLNLNKAHIKSVYKNVIDEIKKSNICFVIGGDTYFKEYSMLDTLYTLNKEARNLKKKNILWCCSIEKDEIDEEMKKDLKEFDLIIARETITLNNLYEKGIKNNVKLYPDPAFTMEPQEVRLPSGWKMGKTIIINTSPLIMKFESKENIVAESIQYLIDYILKNTDYTVALLPHVDCDVITNTKIYEKFKNDKRVININFGYSAPELKYIISKSEILIGARTHATIAAYSMYVPTLVVGYSVKSLGIARDIFGTETDMVIPVNTIIDKEELTVAFKKIFNNKKNIKIYLEEKMPNYKERAYKLEEILNDICG